MAMLGGNVGHGGRGLDAATCAAWGCRIVRFPLRADLDPLPAIRALKAAGLRPLPVLVREAFEWQGQRKSVRQWAELLGPHVELIQGCNEPDGVHEGEGASWVMRQDELNAWLAELRRHFPRPRFTLIGPGLVSGQPGWLQGVDLSLLDAIAPHPYAKAPGSQPLIDLLDGYAAYRKPLWVTEFDSRTPGMAAYLRDHPKVQAALVFCLHDYRPFGLVTNGAALADFRQATGGLPPIIPPKEQPVATSYSVGPGVLAKMAELDDEPVSDEEYHPLGRQPSQWSETIGRSGRTYRYVFATNEVLVFSPTTSAA